MIKLTVLALMVVFVLSSNNNNLTSVNNKNKVYKKIEIQLNSITDKALIGIKNARFKK